MSTFLMMALVMALGANEPHNIPPTALPKRPAIVKQGTIACDLVETTPIIYRNKLYRFEYVRTRYKYNTTGDSYFHFIGMASNTATPAFARGFHLGSPFEHKGVMCAFGVPQWGASTVSQFTCTDTELKTWTQSVALDLPGWAIYNTSVCKGRDGYVMAFEIGEPPEEAGVRFTIRFAESKDLKTWTLLPHDCVYSRDRYTACPALRYVDGCYYMVYLEAYPGPEYEPCIVRSKDLVTWESSPFNPIIKHSDKDRHIANPALTEEERTRIAKAKNINNSDVDFCEYEGKTLIMYSWGDQEGTEFLAKAEYDGHLNDFLKAWFSADK